MSVCLSLLGSLRVALGERQVLFPAGPVTALLGYLGLYASGGRAVSRSRLAGTLWPDYDEARARRALTDALYRARRIIGEESEWLKAGDDSIALEEAHLDVDEFRARAASAAIDDRRAAVALYTGDLLEDLDADWTLGPRAQLRDLYLSLLERLCQSLTDSGDLPEALTVAHRWALADPLNDGACRSAMRLYARLGRHAAALQQYDRFARTLDDELKIEPLAETRALADSIRSDAERQADREDETRRSAFVGRRRERALLLQLAEEAQAGRGGLVLVEGEPGIGKTRLLHAFAEGALWRGIQVAWGRARELEGATPYAPLDEALQSIFAGPRIDQIRSRLSPAAVETLGGILPRLQTQKAGDSGAHPDLPAAIAEALKVVAGVTPHVLIFDDVQWAGPEFWGVVTALASQLAGERLLVVLCYRSEEARGDSTAWRALRDLDRDFAPPRVALGGLTADECAELARGFGGAVDGETALALHRRSGGNPLFVQETVSQGEVETASLHALIERRLAGLAPESRGALEAGAVLGREFTHGAWQSLHGPALLVQIPLLIAARFVEESEQGYRFAHDLVRERVYEAIAPDRLRALHRAAGEMLQRERAEPAALAWHFERAEAWPEAVRYHREAGDRAAGAYAYTLALEHYRQALSLLSSLESSPLERLVILRQRQRVLGVLSQVEAWRADIDAIEELALALGEREALLEVYEARLTLHMLDSDPERLRSTAERAVTLSREIGEPLSEARILDMLGWHLLNWLGRPAEALEHLERAASLAETAHDIGLLYSLICHLSQAQQLIGQCTAARNSALRALALSENYRELKARRAQALESLANAVWELAEWENALVTLREVVHLYEETGDLRAAGYARFDLALLASWMGQHDEARQALAALQSEEGHFWSADVGGSGWWLKALSALLHVYAGELDRASELLEGMQDWMASAHQGRPLLTALIALGRLYLAQDQPARSAEVFQKAVRLLEDSLQTIEVSPLLLQAIAAQRAEDPETARASLGRAESAIVPSDGARLNVLKLLARFEVLGNLDDLRAARAEIQRQADLFTDPQLRAGFLDNVALNREVESRWQALQATLVTARLARADAPLGKTLTDADRVEVRWTPDAGEADSALLRREGKAALRRRRLKRLIAEAAAQGAAPTDDDLARALGVNVRTVERDMAALREKGEAASTRKRR